VDGMSAALSATCCVDEIVGAATSAFTSSKSVSASAFL